MNPTAQQDTNSKIFHENEVEMCSSQKSYETEKFLLYFGVIFTNKDTFIHWKNSAWTYQHFREHQERSDRVLVRTSTPI